MNAREFYYLVKNMRETQRRYFSQRTPEILRAARALENQVDEVIRTTEQILAAERGG